MIVVVNRDSRIPSCVSESVRQTLFHQNPNSLGAALEAKKEGGNLLSPQ